MEYAETFAVSWRQPGPSDDTHDTESSSWPP
jgi:hypothetical protein